MRLGGRIQAAIEVLDDMAARKRPVAAALRDWGLSHRFAGSGDRSVIGNLVHDSLRKQASQAWRMDEESSHAVVFATLLGQWNRDPAQLARELEGDKFAPAFPEAQRLKAWENRSLAEAPGEVQADIPAWCAPLLQAAFGEKWIDQAAALSERAPLDLRTNTLKSNLEKLLKQLHRFGAKPGTLCEAAIRIEAGTGEARLPNVQAEAGYQKGWFEIQDEGSQTVAALAEAKPGEQVLDYCAGAGGKTLALAAAMENQGQIHAYDADRHRLAPIHERLKRAGTRNVQVRQPDDPLDDLKGKMDLVLVDAPCTGSGTWRRKPDAKWRLSPENLEERQAQQADVLDKAVQFVKPGGRLVYITCSLFCEENRQQVGRLLQHNPQFERALPTQTWLHMCNNAHQGPPPAASLTLTPLEAGTDGFFVAMLRRRAA